MNLKDKLYELVYVVETQKPQMIVQLSDGTLDWLRHTGYCETSADGKEQTFTASQIVMVEFDGIHAVTGSLKRTEQSYVLTGEELLNLKKQWTSEAWDENKMVGSFPNEKYPDKQIFINNLKID